VTAKLSPLRAHPWYVKPTTREKAGLAIQVAAALVLWLDPALVAHPAMLTLKLLLLQAAICAAAQRLHDTGRSAWWLVWGFLGLFAWGLAIGWGLMYWLPVQSMQPGGQGFVLLSLAIALPAFAMLTWLHCAPGETEANRFGPVPDGLGFSRRERDSRAVPPGQTATVAG
jgi:uncharacterized membrane protein YhaH (DUF805 family)